MPSEVFNRLAGRYDAWFDGPPGSRIFDAEVKCLRTLMPEDTSGWIEVGVGSGRFAAALGIAEGVDPARAMVEKAAERGVRTRVATAEELPYHERSLGGILLVVTLCFLDEPRRAMQEFARVLKPGGTLLVAIVPADSSWGNYYRRKGRDGHPFYSVARFYTCSEAIEIAEEAGFELVGAATTLPTDPEEEPTEIPVADGIRSGWSFVALRFALANAESVSRPPEVRSVARVHCFSVCSCQSVGRYGMHSRGKGFGQSDGRGPPGISPTPSIGSAVRHLTG